MENITLLKKRNGSEDSNEIRANELLALLLLNLEDTIQSNNANLKTELNEIVKSLIVNDETNKLLNDLFNKIDNITISKNLVNKDDLQHVVEMIPDINKSVIDGILCKNSIYDLKPGISIIGQLNEPSITTTGVMYYNPIMDKVRINTINGWKSLNYE